jgi:hypothetical protein
MCEYCDSIKRITFSDLSDEDKKKEIQLETLKELMCDYMEEKNLGITYEDLGITQADLDEAGYIDIDTEDYNFGKQEFRLIRLYKYVSTASGYVNNIGPKSRSFCVRTATRTNASLMRHQDIIALNNSNPGFGKGGSNSYSVFDWRGGSNCKHKWVKYIYDEDSKRILKAPTNEQPVNSPV